MMVCASSAAPTCTVASASATRRPRPPPQLQWHREPEGLLRCFSFNLGVHFGIQALGRNSDARQIDGAPKPRSGDRRV